MIALVVGLLLVVWKFGVQAELVYCPVSSDSVVIDGDHIYKFENNVVTWSEASRLSIQQGGYLAVITDDSENAIVAQVAGEDAWIGLWYSSAGFYSWINYEPLTYSKWSTSSKPSLTGFVYVDAASKAWAVASNENTTLNGFVVEFEAGVTCVSVSSSLPDCPVVDNITVFEHNEHLYAFESNSTQSWWNARGLAVSRGGYLMTVDSANEEQWLQSHLHTVNETWPWFVGEFQYHISAGINAQTFVLNSAMQVDFGPDSLNHEYCIGFTNATHTDLYECRNTPAAWVIEFEPDETCFRSTSLPAPSSVHVNMAALDSIVIELGAAGDLAYVIHTLPSDGELFQFKGTNELFQFKGTKITQSSRVVTDPNLRIVYKHTGANLAATDIFTVAVTDGRFYSKASFVNISIQEFVLEPPENITTFVSPSRIMNWEFVFGLSDSNKYSTVITALPAHGRLFQIAGNVIDVNNTVVASPFHRVNYVRSDISLDNDSFQFVFTDGIHVSAPAFVNIIPKIWFDPPQNIAKSVLAFEESEICLIWGANFQVVIGSLPAGRLFQTSGVEIVNASTVITSSSHCFFYLHDNATIVQDSFEYFVASAETVSSSAFVNLTIEAPVVLQPGNRSVVVQVHDEALIDLAGNSDLFVVITALPSFGSLYHGGTGAKITTVGDASLGSVRTVRYVHSSPSLDADQFEFAYSNGQFLSQPAVTRMQIWAPVVDDFALNVNYNQESVIELAAPSKLFASIVSFPQYGRLLQMDDKPINQRFTMVSDNQTRVKYVSEQFTSSDTFKFLLQDGRYTTRIATVTLRIQQFQATPVSVRLVLNDRVTIHLEDDVKFQAVILSLPQHGRLSQMDGQSISVADEVSDSNNRVEYEHTATRPSPDSFMFALRYESQQSQPALVNITVAHVVVGEIGRGPALNSTVQFVRFRNAFKNPVVIAQPVLYGSPSLESVPVISGVTTNGFFVRLGLSSADLASEAIDVCWFYYIAMETGVWQLGPGSTVYVGVSDENGYASFPGQFRQPLGFCQVQNAASLLEWTLIEELSDSSIRCRSFNENGQTSSFIGAIVFEKYDFQWGTSNTLMHIGSFEVTTSFTQSFTATPFVIAQLAVPEVHGFVGLQIRDLTSVNMSMPSFGVDKSLVTPTAQMLAVDSAGGNTALLGTAIEGLPPTSQCQISSLEQHVMTGAKDAVVIQLALSTSQCDVESLSIRIVRPPPYGLLWQYSESGTFGAQILSTFEQVLDPLGRVVYRRDSHFDTPMRDWFEFEGVEKTEFQTITGSRGVINVGLKISNECVDYDFVNMPLQPMLEIGFTCVVVPEQSIYYKDRHVAPAVILSPWCPLCTAVIRRSYETHFRVVGDDEGEDSCVDYMIVSSGRWLLPNGDMIQADQVQTRAYRDKQRSFFYEFGHQQAFRDPIVFSQVLDVAGIDDGEYVYSRQLAVTSTGVNITLERDNGASDDSMHTVGIVVMERNTRWPWNRTSEFEVYINATMTPGSDVVDDSVTLNYVTIDQYTGFAFAQLASDYGNSKAELVRTKDYIDEVGDVYMVGVDRGNWPTDQRTPELVHYLFGFQEIQGAESDGDRLKHTQPAYPAMCFSVVEDTECRLVFEQRSVLSSPVAIGIVYGLYFVIAICLSFAVSLYQYRMYKQLHESQVLDLKSDLTKVTQAKTQHLITSRRLNFLVGSGYNNYSFSEDSGGLELRRLTRKTPFFDMVPNDVILEILQYLDMRSLSRISRTCHRLHDLCANQRLWQVVLSQNFDSNMTKKKAKQLAGTAIREMNKLKAQQQKPRPVADYFIHSAMLLMLLFLFQVMIASLLVDFQVSIWFEPLHPAVVIGLFLLVPLIFIAALVISRSVRWFGLMADYWVWYAISLSWIFANLSLAVVVPPLFIYMPRVAATIPLYFSMLKVGPMKGPLFRDEKEKKELYIWTFVSFVVISIIGALYDFQALCEYCAGRIATDACLANRIVLPIFVFLAFLLSVFNPVKMLCGKPLMPSGFDKWVPVGENGPVHFFMAICVSAVLPVAASNVVYVIAGTSFGAWPLSLPLVVVGCVIVSVSVLFPSIVFYWKPWKWINYQESRK